MEVRFIVIVVTLIQHKMAEGQHSIDDVEVAEKKLCVPFLMRSKAGHLSQITKVNRRLNEYCKDYKCLPEVRNEAHRLDAQWKQYAHVYHYDLIQLLPDGGVEKKHEELSIVESILATSNQ